MTQYSFVVYSPAEITLHEVGLSFSAGRNVFTVLTKDLPALLAQFEVEGVRVLALNCIEAPATTIDDLLLAGETSAVINPYARRFGS